MDLTQLKKAIEQSGGITPEIFDEIVQLFGENFVIGFLEVARRLYREGGAPEVERLGLYCQHGGDSVRNAQMDEIMTEVIFGRQSLEWACDAIYSLLLDESTREDGSR